MKITQGYTLSQFVDYIQTEDAGYNFSEGHVNYMLPEHQLEAITKYNDFLKQPLTKEMFVNPLPKPQAWTLYNMQAFECTADEMRLCREYKEAEKKVIFEGWKFESLNEDIREWIVTHESGIFIVKNRGKDTFIIRGIKGFSRIGIRTLDDLFEATNGSLKLKNVEV